MSELVHPSDPGLDGRAVGAAERTYARNGFDPATTDGRLSHTPCRVAKPVFNSYRRNGSQTVSGFLDTSWAYDARLTEAPDDPEGRAVQDGGPGADLARLDAAPGAFDEIVLGLVGLVGDQGGLAAATAQAALDFGIPDAERGAVVFVDPWSAVAAYQGYGFAGWVSNDYRDLFDERKAQGLLGAARRLKDRDPALAVGLHVGGWELGEAFRRLTPDPAARKRFARSVVELLEQFPMFSTLHLDWRWPGLGKEATDYAALVGETRSALSAAGLPATIAVAVPAAVAQLKAMNVPVLVEEGAERFDVMSFDAFGSPWSPGLGHHAALHHDPAGPLADSIDGAVTYLLDEARVRSARIHLGYATTTRNARRARIDRVSPLKGRYDAGPGEVVGSFRPGVSHFADVLRNFLDLERGRGRNGFELYTDTTADADYLHSADSGVYVSLDTPRSVRAKAEYARARNLGGLFAEHAEADPGLLTNAAHEGLGHIATSTVIDMKPLYVTGRTA
ncbi:glycosyl hydrolase family 18 protein [Kitasatospora sp. NPDC059747]|uniref:glycosyl hydrolase family 18 protein n=1 Tax=Kitasatospora sp. NPDC059747 TaxID=3346930 RepID=UPI003648519F